MKLFIILLVSVTAGIASAEHLHSFLLGLYISCAAVGACYWFAFRSSQHPHLALALLICGLFAKIAVTITGVIWGVSQNLISSPLVFALSYLFFSVVATYLWFTIKDRKVTHQNSITTA